MRLQWLVGVFIGAFLIYLGVFGLGGFALPFRFALTGELWKEDFTSVDLWSRTQGTGSYSASNGELVFTGSGRTDLERAPNVVLPTQFTVEFKMKMDAWPGSKTEYYLKLQSATYTHIISVKRDGCFAGSFSASPAAVVTDTNYHVWTVTFDLQVAPGTLKMYKDGTLVGTWAGYSISSTPLTYLIMDTKDEAVATSRTDYIYMDSGIKPPGTTPPPPTQATITVRTWLDSAALPSISVTVAKGGVYYDTWTTDSTGKVTKTVDAGSYSFSASYQSNVGTVSPANPLVASSGSTYTVDISWGTGGPPPDNDWWNNPVVKSILTMSGIGLAGISAIMAVGPFKKKTATYGF